MIPTPKNKQLGEVSLQQINHNQLQELALDKAKRNRISSVPHPPQPNTFRNNRNEHVPVSSKSTPSPTPTTTISSSVKASLPAPTPIPAPNPNQTPIPTPTPTFTSTNGSFPMQERAVFVVPPLKRSQSISHSPQSHSPRSPQSPMAITQASPQSSPQSQQTTSPPPQPSQPLPRPVSQSFSSLQSIPHSTSPPIQSLAQSSLPQSLAQLDPSPSNSIIYSVPISSFLPSPSPSPSSPVAHVNAPQFQHSFKPPPFVFPPLKK